MVGPTVIGRAAADSPRADGLPRTVVAALLVIPAKECVKKPQDLWSIQSIHYI